MTGVNFKMSTMASNGIQEAVLSGYVFESWGEVLKYGAHFVQREFFLRIISINCSRSPSPVGINEMQTG